MHGKSFPEMVKAVNASMLMNLDHKSPNSLTCLSQLKKKKKKEVL